MTLQNELRDIDRDILDEDQDYYHYAKIIFGIVLLIFILVTGYFGVNYFSQSNKIVASTKVVSTQKESEQSPRGVKFAKIQDVQVGERAIGKNPEVTDSERSTFLPDPEPATWRKLTLEMIKSDGKRLDITLLRPLSWIEESNAQISATIFLNLPEMGAQGLAKVLNIEPCPPIKKGRGNVITGTFHHEAANTIDLHVEGLSKPIGCTDNHPFWSVTRNEFIEAGKLQQGEALQLHNGQTTKVVQILPRPGPERVHNLEVMNEHVYRVTQGGLLVHNTCNLPSIKRLNIDIDHIASGHVFGGMRVSANSTKTMFPENWSTQKIQKEIKEAYADATRIQTQHNTATDETRIKLRGTSLGGIVIEMWVNTTTLELETAYPINVKLIQ